ncbi:MAG TPA: aminotransferase class V-fold PLP-dependent enzyme [Candidatus Gastranaerophilales bacterium]|nr:aminotransferase class V-fold PLP-dependent enzyme [Candidatus Gastranaerophilales bacterium]
MKNKDTNKKLILSSCFKDNFIADMTVFNKEKTFFDLNKIETPMLDALEKALQNPTVPLHIPGHAGGAGILPKFKDLFGERIINLDYTDEFSGLGKLYPSDGPIARAQELMAELFNAEKSFFLINGSSVGNLALALTVAKENKKLVIGRNCHRSVIAGLTLTGANPVWIVPKWLEKWGIWGHVNPAEIEKVLDENSDVSAVWITNPTYEGVVSDVEKIASICKQRGVILIVDEAHGCLWNFSDKLPLAALECGADAVVHSLHKTGGSFSQSSVLHIAKESKINVDDVDANLGMLQSTSPSCTLLASLDAARAYLSSEYGRQRVDYAIKNAEAVREILDNIDGVNCLSAKNGSDLDVTKIYITVDGLSGKRLQSILEIEYNIEIETATDEGILALSNIGNTSEQLYYFCECIKNIAKENYSDITHLEKIKYMPLHVPEIVCTPRKAYISEKEKVKPEDGIGRISAEIVAVCPPGIPVLVPGEMITEAHLPYLNNRHFIQVVK